MLLKLALALNLNLALNLSLFATINPQPLFEPLCKKKRVRYFCRPIGSTSLC